MNAEPSRGLSRSLLRSLASLWTGRVAALALQLIAFAILAAHLGPRRLGVYTFALAIAELFRIVPNFGLESVVARDVAQRPTDERSLIPNFLYLRALLGVAAYGLLALVVTAFGYRGESGRAALIAGTMLVLLAAESLGVVLQVRLRMTWVAAADVLRAVIFLAGVSALAARDADVEAFLALYVAASVLSVLVVAVAALRLVRLDWAPRPASWVPLMRAALPVGLAGVFIALYYRLDMVLLARLKPPADLGQYGAAYKFLETYALLPALAMTVLAPVFARSFGDSRALLQRRFARACHLTTVLVLPVVVGGAMTAFRVLPVVPGFAEYDGAGVALAILAPAAAAIFLATIVQGVLVSAHLQRRLLVLAGAGLAVNVALNVVLIPLYSYVGAAAATAATEAFVLLLSVRDVRRRLGLRWPVARLTRTLGAAAAMAAALTAGYLLHPFLQLAAGLAVYALAVGALGALDRRDLTGVLPGGAAVARGSPG